MYLASHKKQTLMQDINIATYLKDVLKNRPNDWLGLTTHRLDIYDERLAKTEFLVQFELLYKKGTSTTEALKQLPTAYDYIRLGHPLSSILDWGIAKHLNVTYFFNGLSGKIFKKESKNTCLHFYFWKQS